MKTLLQAAPAVAGDRSQFGEARVISEILARLEVKPGICVEFGAGDGLHLANTAHLWHTDAWSAVLVECDRPLAEAAEANTTGTAATVLCDVVTPANVNAFVPKTAKVVSIDVDGEDIEILEQMYATPFVLCVEHHPMIPAHVSHRGGADVGCSALALKEWGEDNSYTVVAMTHCNTIMVPEGAAYLFNDVDTDFLHLFDPSGVTFAISNVKTGDYTMHGPWGFGRGVSLDD